uniref:Uncharacterized protein n=1 Tax=Anopheles quadriannulatus TaxID=34691 RepID=A0A182XQN5_ANOQN
MLLPALLPATP